jgi:hypothetical protein
MAGVKGMKQRPNIERSEKQREGAAANLAGENKLKQVLAKDAKRRERQKELDTIRDQYVQDKVAQALEAKNAPKDPEDSLFIGPERPLLIRTSWTPDSFRPAPPALALALDPDVIVGAMLAREQRQREQASEPVVEPDAPVKDDPDDDTPGEVQDAPEPEVESGDTTGDVPIRDDNGERQVSPDRTVDVSADDEGTDPADKRRRRGPTPLGRQKRSGGIYFWQWACRERQREGFVRRGSAPLSDSSFRALLKKLKLPPAPHLGALVRVRPSEALGLTDVIAAQKAPRPYEEVEPISHDNRKRRFNIGVVTVGSTTGTRFYAVEFKSCGNFNEIDDDVVSRLVYVRKATFEIPAAVQKAIDEAVEHLVVGAVGGIDEQVVRFAFDKAVKAARPARATRRGKFVSLNALWERVLKIEQAVYRVKEYIERAVAHGPEGAAEKNTRISFRAMQKDDWATEVKLERDAAQKKLAAENAARREARGDYL